MDDLKVIENDLVPVYETDTGEQVVYGSELYTVLEVKSRFNDWVRNRLNDCEATENEDFQSFTKNLVKGGRPQTEYIIKLDTAKEMAMLERNEKGKQVRRHFIQVEKKYNKMKQGVLDRDGLSLQTKALMGLIESIANAEIEQKRQEEQINRIEERQNALLETFSYNDKKDVTNSDFQSWVNKCLSKIAESPVFRSKCIYRNYHAFAKGESYRRLNNKKGCNLEARITRAKKRAIVQNPSIKNAINKLTVIANDKTLRTLYETVIKEMMVAYYVDI